MAIWGKIFGKDADGDPAQASRRSPSTPTPAPSAAADVDDLALVRSIAEEHLAPDVRDRWLALLRPAIRLVPAAPGEPVVARLGGQPDLPAGAPWPVWEGRGPLSYLAEIDLAATSAFDIDLELPADGRLLFFYFDGSVNDGAEFVGVWDPESMAGQRVVHVAAGAPVARVSAPKGVGVYAERALAGRLVMTSPDWDHPDLIAEFRPQGCDARGFLDHPVNAEAFTEALFRRHEGPSHQLGGYAGTVQGSVEYEVATVALPDLAAEDPRLAAEAGRWRLLLQLDGDDDMVWGDGGCLYWLVRPTDLAAGDLGRILFTWQCC